MFRRSRTKHAYYITVTNQRARGLPLFVRLLLLLCVVAAVLVAAYFMGYRVNLTKSLPCRIYRVISLSEISRSSLSRGDSVVIDVSLTKNPHIDEAIDRAYILPGIPMLKQIGGVPGDTLFLSNDTLHIADISFRTVVASEDSKGRTLSPYPTPLVLSNDLYWLVSDPERGYDSRYFGPIRGDAFTHVAIPVL